MQRFEQPMPQNVIPVAKQNDGITFYVEEGQVFILGRNAEDEEIKPIYGFGTVEKGKFNRGQELLHQDRKSRAAIQSAIDDGHTVYKANDWADFVSNVSELL